MLDTGESNAFKNNEPTTWHNGVERVKGWFYNPNLETKYNGAYTLNTIIAKVWKSKCCFRYTELRVTVRYPNENIL